MRGHRSDGLRAIESGTGIVDEMGRRMINIDDDSIMATIARFAESAGRLGETIIEREEDARVVVIGKRGAGHEFANDHIGSKIERVVRASVKPVLIASRQYTEPQSLIFAYDAGPAAERALERLIVSPIFEDLPVHVVMADTESAAHREALELAATRLRGGRPVEMTLQKGRPEAVISAVVDRTPNAMLVMGAYGHSPIRTLIVGSTTTTMIRTVRIPVLLVR